MRFGSCSLGFEVEKDIVLLYSMAMKLIQKAAFASLVLSASLLLSCKTLVGNALSTALAGANGKGVPQKKKASAADPMIAITGETDVTLVGEFFPTVLKSYEILQAANPRHIGLMTMTGSLNIMYANAFVQTPAETLPNEEFDRQHEAFERAKLHYLRGRDLCLKALDGRHAGFRASVLSGDEEAVKKACAKLGKYDVEAAYWACAGWLGAFSLDPLSADLLGTIRSPALILERVAFLAPDYNAGAIWELLCNFYMSAPSEFGGDTERGLHCYNEALRASGGKTPGPYVTYAEAICVPAGDRGGFEDSLRKALAIDPDADPSSRLMTTIVQKKAKRLLEHASDYFLEW